MARRSILAALLPAAALLLAVTPFAATALAQDDDTPVLRTSTRLVQLNVVVLDKDNHPVSNLTLTDFHIYDNGIEQKLVHFSPSQPLPPSSPTRSSPLVISNRQAADDIPRGVTAILVDEFLLDSPQVLPAEVTAPIRSARLSVLSYLSSMQPGEQVALYAMRREGIVVIHDFTSDSAALVAAAKTLGGGGLRGKSVNLSGLSPESARALRGWTDSGRSAPRPHDPKPSDDFSSLLTSGLASIVQHLQAVPGRKNLVWISSTLPSTTSGFDMRTLLNGANANVTPTPTLGNPTPTPSHASPEDQYEQMREFARWLSNSNIAVYPLDANGLTTGGSSQGQWSAADIIATETGGRAFFDSNALDQHLREIAAEADSFYQIGYYPGDAAWDGKYHKIHVRLSATHKALSVRCRRGYFAADQPVTANSNGALLEAARSVVESPAVGLALNVPSNPLLAGPQNLVLKIDLRDIQFDFDGPHAKADLDIAFVQLAKDGRVIDKFKDRINLAFPQETYLAFATQGWFYPRQLWIPREAEKLRVVVRDLATGATGSISVPVVFNKASR